VFVRLNCGQLHHTLDRHLHPHTMRSETESLEGLGGQSRKGHAVQCPRGLFVLFYCLTVKIGTLVERPLLADIVAKVFLG
jgi:hypothetical protein